MCSWASFDVCRFELLCTSAHHTVDLLCLLRPLCYIWWRLFPLFALSICRSTRARFDVCRFTVYMVAFRHVIGSAYVRGGHTSGGTCPRGNCSDTSSTTLLLSVPCHNFSFGSRTFFVSAPRICNTLPPSVLDCKSLTAFGRYSLFPVCFYVATQPQIRSDSYQKLELYKSFTHFLTY